MSLFDRLFGWASRLLRRRSAPRPARLPLDAAWAADPRPPEPAVSDVDPVVAPALGAAAGQAAVVEAWERVELAGAEPPVLVERETVDAAESGAVEADLDDEDVFEEEERAADLDGVDAGDDERSDLDERLHARLLATPHLRGEAEREALSGEHRIGLADPGGPGTLAEALIRLEREGAVTCELGEDEAGSPVLVYRPAGVAPATVH